MSSARAEIGMKRGLCVLLLACIAATPGLAADLPPLTHGLTPIAEPKPAPGLRLTDLDGKIHDLADLKGKLVLVNFWATWCPPCRREMPSLERLSRYMAGKGLVILAVNVGESADTVFAFTGQLEPQPNFPILLDQDSKVLRAWPVKGLPTSFMLDRQGRITYRAVGGREFDDPGMVALIEGLLSEAQGAE